MSKIKETAFDEKVYTIMKEEYKEYRKSWENRFESLKEKSDTEKKEYEKKLKKIEIELFKYSKYDSFLAWYLVYEYKLNEKLLYDIKEKNWYCYEIEKKYLWELINEEIALSIIDEYSYKAVPWDFNTKISNYTRRNELILKNLKSLLEFDFQKDANFELVIFKNDVVVNTKKAEKPIVTAEIGPKDYIVQSCPIEWIPDAKCPSISNFFNYITDNNENNEKADLIKLIKCIMHVTTRSNRAFNLQFFLEINGIGGSGKTLLQKIFECLVPSTQKITSTIDSLEKSQFESAYFKNKNLCVFSDHTGFVGEATMIKKLSGGELIPAEFKHKDKTYFIYYGVIIITTNLTLRYSASESSIIRRRIELTLDKEAPFEETKEEVLYFDEKGFPAGPWANELPGLIQEIYKLSFKEVRSTIKTYLENQKHNTEASDFISMIKSNFIIFDKGEIGVTTNKYGFPMYKIYEKECEIHGYSKLSTTNYRELFKTEYIKAFPKHRIQVFRSGSGWYFKGLLYIQILPEELQKLVIKNYREAYGQKAYLDIDYNPGEARIMKKEIEDNNPTLHKLLQECEQKCLWHKYIGLAITKENPQIKGNTPEEIAIAKEESQKYVLNYFLKNTKLYENFIVLVENSDELIELMAIFLKQEYQATRYEGDDCKVATQTLFDGFVKFLEQRKKQTKLQPNQIKSKLIAAWAKAYPPENYIQIKEVNNIKPNNLKGFMYIQPKRDKNW